MKATDRLFALLVSLGMSFVTLPAVAQPDCQKVGDIEALNQGKLRRTARIEGRDAILFIALDPVFSAPEFDFGDQYRDEYFIDTIKSARESLYGAGIDQVVVWRLPRRSMGVAVPFKDGCAVSGYGEPDDHDKLMTMNATFLEISRFGLDAPSVRGSIERLLKNSRYRRIYNDEMIDVVIGNLRPLIAAHSSADRVDEE